MFSFAKITSFAVVGLGMTGTALAAPVHNATELVARGPYDTHYGWATYYNPSAGTGACGWNNRDDEWVAAIGTGLFQQMMIDGNPNHSQACGKTATATWNGKSITVGIVDRCYACGTEDIDLSPSAFQQFSGLGTGKLTGFSWRFN
ncbi:rare lipoprotein A-like double-psi beta-barrel protein [Ceratobasidium sp. AG-Ba]|nr:rare lipoprotein A-like double-psi beta-barrel protein [Ceratobasidium sp. AG-Ba]